MGKSPQAYLGLYQTSMMMFFVAKLELIEQIGPKILKKFREIYLRLIIHCPHKGFYDHIAFHFLNITLTHWLAKTFLVHAM